MKRNFYEIKVVRTRKEHECVCCGKPIPKGSRTLVESGFNKDEGFFSNYFHIDKENGCYLDYLDACQPNDLTRKDAILDGFISRDHLREALWNMHQPRFDVLFDVISFRWTLKLWEKQKP